MNINNVTPNKKMSFAAKSVIIIIAGITLWMLSGLLKSDKENHNQEVRDYNSKSNDNFFRTINSQAKLHNAIIKMNGTTIAKNKVLVLPEVSGKITNIPAVSGQKMKKGDTIAKVEVKNKLETLESTRSKLKQAQLQLDSTKILFNKGFSSKLQLSMANEGVDRAIAEMKQAELDWNNTLIKAPFDGYIDYIKVKNGDLVEAGKTPIASYVDLSNMIVQAHVAEKDIAEIANAINAVVYLDDDNNGNDECSNNAAREAKVKFLSRVADQDSATFLLELEVSNKDLAFVSGQSVTIDVNIGEKLAHEVPQSALNIEDNGELGVKVLDQNKKVSFYKISIIGENPNSLIVTGLPNNAEIIILGQAYVKTNQILSK